MYYSVRTKPSPDLLGKVKLESSKCHAAKTGLGVEIPPRLGLRDTTSRNIENFHHTQLTEVEAKAFHAP